MLELDINSLGDEAISILNNLDQSIIILDNQGNFLFVNTKVTEILGYEQHELMGLSYAQAVELLVGSKCIEEITQARDQLDQGSDIVEIRKFTHKSGSIVPLEVKAMPIFDHKKRVCGKMLRLKELYGDLLVKIANLVNSTLSLDEVLDHTTTAVVEYLGLASNAVFLFNKEREELQLVSCNAMDAEACSKVTLKVGEGAPGKIFQERKPVYIRDMGNDPLIHETARPFHGAKSSIGYPLICKDELLGIIAFDSSTIREFTQREKYIFENVAIYVALAIYNAQLFSSLEHLAITDGLTGLFNHRYFHDRIEEEIERTLRGGKVFSLLMCDVDYFKKYNDTYGHMAGDIILKKIAKILENSARKPDVVARYGGEEFTVILVDCPLKEAVIIAERMRGAVENMDIDNEADPLITISVGISSFTGIEGKEQVINSADKALYKAKRLGRNRVEIAE